MPEEYYEETEPRYISYEKYEDLETEYRRLENDYHDINYKLEELVSYLKEVLESKNFEERSGELYEWCKEYKYF